MVASPVNRFESLSNEMVSHWFSTYNYKPQLRAELENDKLAYYKEIYARHGAGRTNLAYGYALKNG